MPISMFADVSAAPGHGRQIWDLERPLDALEFVRTCATSRDVDRLLSAHGKVNNDRFHGWRAGSMVFVLVSAFKTDHTIRREPTFMTVCYARIVCLAGLAHQFIDDRGRVVSENMREFVRFGDLPVGPLVNPSPRRASAR